VTPLAATTKATIAAWRSSGSATAHGPGVVEHLLVTHGRARAGLPGSEIEVGPGETAVWESDADHGYQALGPTAVEAVLTIRSPSRDPGQAG
jgi:quercetin dioxygenase-like cupin family protein